MHAFMRAFHTAVHTRNLIYRPSLSQGTIVERAKVMMSHRPESLATYIGGSAGDTLLVGLGSGELAFMKYGEAEVAGAIVGGGGGAAAAGGGGGGASGRGPMTLTLERKREVSKCP